MPAAPTVTRKDLLTAMITSGKTISKIEIKEVTMGSKQTAPLHLHPCPVVGVVTTGTIAFQIEGETVQYLKVGDHFMKCYVRVTKSRAGQVFIRRLKR